MTSQGSLISLNIPSIAPSTGAPLLQALNVEAEWLAFPWLIPNVPGSDFGPEAGNPEGGTL
jgi:hypothetical protein